MGFSVNGVCKGRRIEGGGIKAHCRFRDGVTVFALTAAPTSQALAFVTFFKGQAADIGGVHWNNCSDTLCIRHSRAHHARGWVSCACLFLQQLTALTNS